MYKHPTKTVDKLKERLLCNPKIKMFAFNFPRGIGVIYSLNDILEEQVAPKYFLSQDRLKKMFHRVRKNQKEGMCVRRLTPTEAERLQSFPDGWTETGIDVKGNETLISDTQRYRCLGNAVTVNVIEAIAERLLSPQGETD